MLSANFRHLPGSFRHLAARFRYFFGARFPAPVPVEARKLQNRAPISSKQAPSQALPRCLARVEEPGTATSIGLELQGSRGSYPLNRSTWCGYRKGRSRGKRYLSIKDLNSLGTFTFFAIFMYSTAWHKLASSQSVASQDSSANTWCRGFSEFGSATCSSWARWGFAGVTVANSFDTLHHCCRLQRLYWLCSTGLDHFHHLSGEERRIDPAAIASHGFYVNWAIRNI